MKLFAPRDAPAKMRENVALANGVIHIVEREPANK
jgi:hypothetical protein